MKVQMVLLVLAALSLFAVFVSATSTPLPWHLSLRAAIVWILFSNVIKCTEIQKSARCALPFCNEILPKLLRSNRITIGQTAGVNLLGARCFACVPLKKQVRLGCNARWCWIDVFQTVKV